MKNLSLLLLAGALALAATSANADVTVVKTVRVDPPANIFEIMRDFENGKLTSFKSTVEFVYSPTNRFSIMEQKFIYPKGGYIDFSR